MRLKVDKAPPTGLKPVGFRQITRKEFFMKSAKQSVITKLALGVLLLVVASCLTVNIVSIHNTKVSLNRMAEEELSIAAFHFLSQANNEYDGKWDYKGGILYKGYDKVAESYQEDIDALKEQTRLEYSIVMGKTRVVSTMKDQIGKDVSDTVADTVLKGRSYFNQNIKIGSETFYGYYLPLNNDNETVGMIFVGRRAGDIKGSINAVIWKVSLIVTIIILVIGAGGFVLARYLRKSIGAMNSSINSIADGNLVITPDPATIERQDEFGDISRSMMSISHKLTDVIKKISGLSEKVKDSGDSLQASITKASTATGQVGKAVEDIAKGAQEQAESVQKSADNSSEIGNSLDNLNENIDRLKELAAKMEESSATADSSMTELLKQNGAVTKSVNSIGDVILETAECVNEIEKSTTAIEAIATQTNLLSLNASIEAAHAGDAGRGFAVVANEIQELADQSKQAANKINDIVKKLAESSAESTENVELLKKAFAAQNEKLGSTKTSLSDTTSNAAEVARAASAVGDLSEAMNVSKDNLVSETESLSAISEENAASAEETNASMEELSQTFAVIEGAAEELQQLAVQLDEELQYFKTE